MNKISPLVAELAGVRPRELKVSGSTPKGNSDLSGAGKPAGLSRRAGGLRHSDFERVYKQGQRHFAAHMTLFYLRRAPGLGSRIGFTLGRILGSAVERNRMRRRLREAVRGHVPVDASADVVIHPKKSLQTVKFRELQGEVARALQVIQEKLRNQATSANAGTKNSA